MSLYARVLDGQIVETRDHAQTPPVLSANKGAWLAVADGVEPAPEGSRVRRTDALRHLLLELVDPRPERQPPGPQHLEDELLLPLIEPGPGERDLPDDFPHAFALAGSVVAYSSQ